LCKSMELLRYIKLRIKWVKTWKSWPVATWVKAASEYRRGHFGLAVKYYLKGIERYPSHPARWCARIDLARCYFELGQLGDSIKQLEIVVEGVPSSRRAGLRLARLYSWTGNRWSALSILIKLNKVYPKDIEVAAALAMTALDLGEGRQLRALAQSALQVFDAKELSHPSLEVARAALAIHRGDLARGRAVLMSLVSRRQVPVAAHVYLAKLLMCKGQYMMARGELRRALYKEARHPRVLCLLAEIYLEPGALFNPEYAQQLAIRAVQNSIWASPREIYILARVYCELGDKMSALLVANQAKEVGTRLGWKEEKLDKLIASLSFGTLA
jgi:tetratricopeptide (TPR) repeat protein